METEIRPRSNVLSAPETWIALGASALILLIMASRRSRRRSTKTALAGPRGVHVREFVRLNAPLPDVYRFWRRLENLPLFLTHLNHVTESSDGRSHWVAQGPAGMSVEWDAEIINEIENEKIAWRSLPGSEVMTAGSVTFDPAAGGRCTDVSVNLQYAPPAGRAGAFIASLFGVEPSQTIREDLRRFKQLLEADGIHAGA